MKTQIRAACLALSALAAAPQLAPAQESGSEVQPAPQRATRRVAILNDDPRAISRVYRVAFLANESTMDAVMLAHQICLDQPGDRVCDYSMQGRKWFTYATDLATHDLIAAEMERRDVPPMSLNFRVAVLLADNIERPEPPLPPGEARALADLKQFLPYQGYRFVDSGAVRTMAEGSFRLGTAYDVRLRFRWSAFPVRRELTVDGFRLGLLYKNEDGGEEFKQLLSTSFSSTVGETVVVGTSKLNGSKEALIVLLTAEE